MILEERLSPCQRKNGKNMVEVGFEPGLRWRYLLELLLVSAVLYQVPHSFVQIIYKNLKKEL